LGDNLFQMKIASPLIFFGWLPKLPAHKYGCVVGYSTHMFCTTDEGVTWTSKDVLPVRSNGQSDFFKNLVILESGRGWVLREGGYLYRTIDSGLTWHVLDPINPSVSE
jgi:photosystem II stability/assembly factor-like uncharacterized protein